MNSSWGKKHIKFKHLRILAGLSSLALAGCQGMGYQGGSLPSSFGGVSSAIAVSPETIQLSWTPHTGASKYNVYTPAQNQPIYQPTFNSILFQPSPIDPNATYQYSVTAVEATNNKEVGSRSSYAAVQLLPHFNFKNDGSASPVSKTSIRVNWVGYPTVSYLVYLAERDPTGTINYNNFVASKATVTGVSSATITGLTEGREYCAVVVAAYTDQKNDAPNGTLFTGDISSTLRSNTYMIGPSGGFGDSVIAQSQKCARTQSDFAVDNIKIYTQKASISSQPTFYVSVPGDTVEDSNGSVNASIYQVSSSGISTLVGSRIGTGKIQTTSSIASGRQKFFALVSDRNGTTAQAKIEISVGMSGTVPASENDRAWVYIRALASTENPSAPVGYYPSKQQGGYGAQRAGAAVATGDFNCDGKFDIAYGLPNASAMLSDNRPAKLGRVVVYYDVTSSSPSSTSRVQNITFDITGTAGEAARDLRLGTTLYAGNFNKDNQTTSNYGSSAGLTSNQFQCHDLAIGSGYGPMFVLYGKRDTTGTDGGLNYLNPTNYDVNASGACDPGSNVCSPVMYTQTNYNFPLGVKFTSGDFNGDGFEDLVASSTNNIGDPRGIWVLRGSEYGLIPPPSYNQGVDSISTNSGAYLSFPFIPATWPTTLSSAQAGWGGDSFGSSLGVIHNAFYDTNTAKTKGSKRIRDVLLIGNPTSKKVHACLPKSDYTASTFGTIGSNTDPNTAFNEWDCSNAMIGPNNGTDSINGFGYEMVSIRNALRYHPAQFTEDGCAEGFGNCTSSSLKLGYPGAVAISSVNTAEVYLAYGVARPTPGGATRDDLGLARNTYLTSVLFAASPSNSVNESPCSISGGFETCVYQKIVHPSSGTGSYGSILSAFPGNVSPSDSVAKDSILAVGSPNRSVTLTNGTTYINVGSVQIYQQNSRATSNPHIVLADSTTGANNGISRLADGFTNGSTTGIDYSQTLSSDINFGLGGIVGAPLISSGEANKYNSNTDIIVGAPGHRGSFTNNGVPLNVSDNGAAMIYFSHGGQYRTRQITDPNGSVSVWHLLDPSFSQESDMKYHQAIALGDINQDNVGDIAVRINQGSKNSIRILSGKTDQVGFDTQNSTLLTAGDDASAGLRMIPAGVTTPYTFPTYFVTGTNASYLFFGGIGGIIQGFPTAGGTGGTPRKFYAPSGGYCDSNFSATCIPYLGFKDSNYYNVEVTGNLDSNLKNMNSFASGDFNGDGISDLAIGWNEQLSIADLSKTKGCVNNYCASGAKGRVLVLYGGSDNGFQTQPDASGGYPRTSTFMTNYSSGASPTSIFGAPCSATGTNCKIQMIHEPNTATFGSTLASVPVGTCTINGKTSTVHALTVLATFNSGLPAIYAYRPKCLNPSTNEASGLVSYAETVGAPATLTVPADSSSTLGISMQSFTNIMGSSSTNVAHLVVADQGKSRIMIYPVRPFTSGVSFQNYSVSGNGARLIDYTSSAMMNGTNGTNTLFGTTLAQVGDVNGDGFNDVAVSVPKLARKDVSTQTPAQGALLFLFGGSSGLQSHSGSSLIEPSRTASCFVQPSGATTLSVCNPALFYLPQPTNSIRNGAYERISLFPSAFLNFGTVNENLGTFIVGSPGRDSLETTPSSRILQGGAFYVLP